ncbi:hypothetical protein BGZ98_007492 [Dissophora globulifera]|nr:hypothetical protein BGZ98_007492 [Dissophora globulifera]
MKENNTVAGSDSSGNGFISGVASRIASRIRRRSSQPQLPLPVSAGAAYLSHGSPFDTKDLPVQPLLLLCPSPAAEATNSCLSEIEVPTPDRPVGQGISVLATNNFPNQPSRTKDSLPPPTHPQEVKGIVDLNIKSNALSIDDARRHNYIMELNDHNGHHNPALTSSDSVMATPEQLAAAATTDTEVTPVLVNSFPLSGNKVPKTTTTSGWRAAPTLSHATVPPVLNDFQKSSDIPLIGKPQWRCLPVSITLDNEWTAMLEMDNINSGWYSVVLCISFDNKENKTGGVSLAEFDVHQFDASSHPVDTKKTCRTVAEREELRTIKSGEEKRIRLHRQIELSQGGFIRVTAMLQAQDIQAVKVHYIELQQDSRNADDLVLYGEGKPDEVILLGVSPDAATKEHLTVHAHDISATGTHAVTLCFDSKNQAVIDVWSLLPHTVIAPSSSTNNADRNKPKTLQQPPLQHTSPLARGIISASNVNHTDRADICLSISADGRYVAVHSNHHSQNGISCHTFLVNTNNSKGVSINNDMNGHQFKSSLSILPPRSLPQSLRNFFGYGTFHLTKMASTKDRSLKASCDQELDCYITSDGKSVSVYKTTDNWVMVRNITLGVKPHFGAALNVISSLRGRYFAWTGSEGVLSIWDLTSGQQVSYFKVEAGSAGTRAHISRDGSLVAVSVKAAITVHETATGIKLGSYLNGLGESNSFEILLEKYHAMVLDQLPLKDAKEKMVERKIVAVSDMSVVRTYRIHRDYAVQSPVLATDQIFSYSQGSVVNIIRMDTKLISAPAPNRFSNHEMTDLRIDRLSSTPQSYPSAEAKIFSVASSTSVIHGTRMTLTTISYAGNVNQPHNGSKGTLTIPVGSSYINHPAVFIKPTSRLAVVTGRYLQVWKLHDPSTTNPKSGFQWDEIAELELLWDFQREDEEIYQDTDTCKRKFIKALADMELVEQFSTELRLTRFSEDSKEMPKDLACEGIEVITVPKSLKDNLPITLQERIKQGIRGVVDMYINGDEVCQRATIRYLRTLVRPSDNNHISCIVTLCRFWKREERAYFERIMKDLLPSTDITWIPVNSEYEKDQDPLAILIKTAETQPAAIGVAKVIMDYCVSHAISSRNLAFLTPIFKSMHRVLDLFPEEAFECLSRMAFIPAKDRSYILDNHIIARSPRMRFQFWKPEKNFSLTNKLEPIMQLHVTPTGPDASTDRFTLPLFMASFDALWSYHDEERDAEHERRMKAKRLSRHPTTRNGLKTAVATTSETKKTSRWTTFMSMFQLKLRLRNKTYVECHDFKNFEYFGNPAIAALVAFKWNTMGFRYWLIRFIFQCLHYVLILVAAILQVYLADTKILFGVFVAIIVMAAIFTWLEILQAIQAWNKYRRHANEPNELVTSSPYNFLELVAFLVPMAASVDQIVIILQNDQHGNARLLSFSLYELRINQNICKYVTIIQHAVAEMRVFFFIFAAGIVVFTIGMLHLLHACPVGGCPSVDDGSTDTDKPGFPTHFLHALSSTYFFMGGRYDDVNDKFNSDDWAFHIMMVTYFFCTVIVMLNVLIALINVAFTKGGDGWRLAWVASRMRYIEAAENMSYLIPGYRESHNCFPKEIYFSSTPQKVKVYQEWYHKKYNLNSSEQSLLAGAKSTAAALVSEARDGPTLDADGTEGGLKTEIRNEKSKGGWGNENDNGIRNENNTENEKAILELRGKIESLQEQSERQFEKLKEQSERQLEELRERSEKQLEELKELLRHR